MLPGNADAAAKRISMAALILLATAAGGLAWIAHDWSAPVWVAILLAGAIVLWLGAALIVLAPLGIAKVLSVFMRARRRAPAQRS